MRYKWPVYFFNSLAVLLVAGVLLLMCGRPKNYSQAQVRMVNGKQFVLLKGRRALMAHDPVSALLSSTYEDSVLLPLPAVDGIVMGKDIPTRPGHHAYGGKISRSDKSVVIGLCFNGEDGTLIDSVGWNGSYELSAH